MGGESQEGYGGYGGDDGYGERPRYDGGDYSEG